MFGRHSVARNAAARFQRALAGTRYYLGRARGLNLLQRPYSSIIVLEDIMDQMEALENLCQIVLKTLQRAFA
jgi:hypothetical protein